jgi:hypothetical protein
MKVFSFIIIKMLVYLYNVKQRIFPRDKQYIIIPKIGNKPEILCTEEPKATSAALRSTEEKHFCMFNTVNIHGLLETEYNTMFKFSKKRNISPPPPIVL